MCTHMYLPTLVYLCVSICSWKYAIIRISVLHERHMCNGNKQAKKQQQKKTSKQIIKFANENQQKKKNTKQHCPIIKTKYKMVEKRKWKQKNAWKH